MSFTQCCEHNPCPQRPERFLRRFRVRPWVCPQCGNVWITEPGYSWGEFAGWTWLRAEVRKEHHAKTQNRRTLAELLLDKMENE